MKRLIVLVPLVLFLVSSEMHAQVKCTIPCWEQSFLYQFCPVSTTTVVLGCSTDPNDDPLGSPIKAYIPGLTAIFNESTLDTLWQPSDSVAVFMGTPPDRGAIFDDYVEQILENIGGDFLPPPWAEPFPDSSDFWDGDSDAYAAGLYQWNIDSTNFFAGADQYVLDYTGLDGDIVYAIHAYSDQDKYGLFDWYHGQDSTYLADSAWYAGGFQVSYIQPWNDAQADSDAQHALDHWLGVCSPAISPDGPTCTIHIMLDPIVADWSSRTDPDPKDILANTILPKCDEASCADVQRVTIVNTSPAFLYQSNNSKNWFPNPAYKLHASPKVIWYTGTGRPNLPDVYVNAGYNFVSFYQLMEHELGHWLGLEHPEWGPSNMPDYSCPNCYTGNPYVTGAGAINPSGFWTVMAQNLNFPGDTALLLTNEDSCQFKKLYCAGDVSVKLGPNTNDWFNPEVYPNPSNGNMTLTFTTIAQSLTQISIYDMLGNNVKEVSNGYLNMGQQTISLGTETLPSGSYVCRVRVGDRVSYINLAITK